MLRLKIISDQKFICSYQENNKDSKQRNKYRNKKDMGLEEKD